MWMSSAPLRISLAGGGTDVPSYASRFGGAVLGSAIDLRVTVVGQAGGSNSGIRACLEDCMHTDDPEGQLNPFVREVLRRHWNGSPLRLASFGDVPGGSGLGSSSAFCCALISGLSGGTVPPDRLAEAAGDIEISGLGRPVGRQDPLLSAYGGVLQLHFDRSGAVEVERVEVAAAAIGRLDEDLLLFFTGAVRDAGRVLTAQHERIERGDRKAESRLHEIKELTAVAHKAVVDGDARALGLVLGRHWELKRQLSEGVSLPFIDRAYEDALTAGSVGGKILGAGGGGFLLLCAPAKVAAEVRAVMSAHGFTEQAFRMAGDGPRVVHHS
jgi:D-glycero-alpha-D-manno-heptose-7-phosphate kinase